MKRVLLRVGLALAPLVLALGVLLFIYSGVYDVASTRQHTAPVYWMLITTLKQSIFAHAEGIHAPPLDDPVLARRGFVLYDEYCVPCHGAPGVPLTAVGMGLTPLPGNLVPTAREWSSAEIYWTVRNGLKMTGMPAWEYRFSDADLWAVVAFVKTLPGLSPADYRALRDAIRPMPAHDREPSR